jgi:hypothetical protein
MYVCMYALHKAVESNVICYKRNHFEGDECECHSFTFGVKIVNLGTIGTQYLFRRIECMKNEKYTINTLRVCYKDLYKKMMFLRLIEGIGQSTSIDTDLWHRDIVQFILSFSLDLWAPAWAQSWPWTYTDWWHWRRRRIHLLQWSEWLAVLVAVIAQGPCGVPVTRSKCHHPIQRIDSDSCPW